MTATRTVAPHAVTVFRDGLGYQFRAHFPGNLRPYNGGYDLTREAAVWQARNYLRMFRVNHTTDPEVIARAVDLVAPRLTFPPAAARLVAELDGKGLLAGGFPSEDAPAAADVAAIVRWRQVKTPAGCYTAADYERAAGELAAELHAAGLLVAAFGGVQ